MAKNAESAALLQQGLKYCSKCDKIKPVSEFSKKKSAWDGLRSNCKACDKVYHDNYRSVHRNKERELAYGKAYRREHAEQVKIYNKKYREENPEIVRKARKRWHLRNKESENAISRERMRLWAKENRERHRTNGRRRRARKFKAKGTHTFEQEQHLLSFFNGKCPCCNKKRKLTLDHIVPLVWGGSNYIINLQALCKRCNSTKGDRHDTDYRSPEVKAWAKSEMESVQVEN